MPDSDGDTDLLRFSVSIKIKLKKRGNTRKINRLRADCADIGRIREHREVVIHDLKTKEPEHSIIYCKNGHATDEIKMVHRRSFDGIQ